MKKSQKRKLKHRVKRRRGLFLFNYHKKKKFLFLRRNLHKFRVRKFGYSIIIRVKSNNIFCTLNNVLTKKTVFSCLASRYQINITAKRLRYQTLRIITFFYHEIKLKLQSKGLIIKIIAPKFFRTRIARWCKYNFSSFYYQKKRYHRNIFFQINNYKSFNGCRVKKRRRKKRRKLRSYKKI